MNDHLEPNGAGLHGAGPQGAGVPLPPFPPEQGWLDQPLPSELADVDLGAFAARTLDAVRGEQQLDRDLAALDRDLPRIVLSALEVPPPAPDFVPSVLAALHQDRRARWQQLLSRHIAPEPSPEFVARTLSALRDVAPRGPGGGEAAPAARRPLATSEPTAPTTAASAARRPWRRRSSWLTAAAAAALLAVALLRRDALRPLEARLAEQVPPIEAHAAASSPLAFVLAAHERRIAPDAIAAGNADGVWLQLMGGR